MIFLKFDKGTICVEGNVPPGQKWPGLVWDERTSNFRAPAYYYRQIVMAIRSEKLEYTDNARSFAVLPLPLVKKIQPRDHQQNALQAFAAAGKCGVVVMPTGSGKTILACLAIEITARPTLILVPTLDLMQQWVGVLQDFFCSPLEHQNTSAENQEIKIGMWGGGSYDTQKLTVSTYDSAIIHMPHSGSQFGFLIFDECHHLPGPQTRLAAIMSVAPFRLGLTATLERSDGRHADLQSLCGPTVFEVQIGQLSHQTLSPYDVHTIPVALSAEERATYDSNRECYLKFVRERGIDFRRSDGWSQFIRQSARDEVGRAAFKSYLIQKKIAQSPRAKLLQVWQLIVKHKESRILIFTQDNDTAYLLGTLFCLPVLTHHTRMKERIEFLKMFKEGTRTVLVTSKVLNEGVDVPEASVAIVVSGSATVREHVQRLGRILRASPGKKAVLYEIVSDDTSELSVNERRRAHNAYERPS